MSTEIGSTPASFSGRRHSVSVTSFSGGKDGRCLQLTQNHTIVSHDTKAGWSDWIHLDTQQADILCRIIQHWLDGSVPPRSKVEVSFIDAAEVDEGDLIEMNDVWLKVISVRTFDEFVTIMVEGGDRYTFRWLDRVKVMGGVADERK